MDTHPTKRYLTNAPIQTPPRSLQTRDNNLVSSSTRDERCADDLLIALSRPMQLLKLEQDAIQRRALLKTRVHDVYQRVAAWLSTLATEVVERDASFVHLTNNYVNELDAAAERILNRLESKMAPISSLHVTQTNTDNIVEEGSTGIQDPSITVVEHHCSNVSYRLNQYTHEMVPQLLKDHLVVATAPSKSTPMNLDDPSSNITSTQDNAHELNMDYLKQVLQMESSLARKAEGQIIRQFESLAGTCAQRLSEEQGKREASIQLLKKEMETFAEVIKTQTEEWKNKKRELRDVIDKERQERILGDEHVLQTILHEKKRMQEKILDLFTE